MLWNYYCDHCILLCTKQDTGAVVIENDKKMKKKLFPRAYKLNMKVLNSLV